MFCLLLHFHLFIALGMEMMMITMRMMMITGMIMMKMMMTCCR